MINGQKMWTSLIQYADWIWLACRTDPDLPRHKGLSMILVPADSPGFSYTPVHTVAGVGTSATYYEDVRVPGRQPGRRAQRRLVADDQPAQPRAGRAHLGRAADALASAWSGRWAQETKNPDGQRVIDTEWVQIALGRAHARAEMLTLLNWKLASDVEDLSPAEASATKIYGSELATEVYRSLMEIVGPNAGVTGDSDGRGARRPARALLPLRAGDDVRRRHQRDPARHHRVRRPRPPRAAQEETLTWTSPSPPSRTRPPSWPRGSSRTAPPTSG